MPSATADGITIINFGMGSPNAATIMDLLSAISPNAVLFLGKCGGLEKKEYFRRSDTSNCCHKKRRYIERLFPNEVPALPAFKLQSAISATITRFNREYWTGTVYTTNRRVWEYDDRFKKYLVKTRAMAIDMETATIFTVGFANEIPTGALLLVSDQPMISTGIKTEASDVKVTNDFVEMHLKIGIDSLREIIDNGVSVKHLKF
jgi:AMP nucleosidase